MTIKRPLTTHFTPSADCSTKWTYHSWGSLGSSNYVDQFASNSPEQTTCFPSGYTDRFTYLPVVSGTTTKIKVQNAFNPGTGGCPVGYEPAFIRDGSGACTSGDGIPRSSSWEIAPWLSKGATVYCCLQYFSYKEPCEPATKVQSTWCVQAGTFRPGPLIATYSTTSTLVITTTVTEGLAVASVVVLVNEDGAEDGAMTISSSNRSSESASPTETNGQGADVNASSPGVSTGVRVGIAVGCAAGLLIALMVVGIFILRRRRRRKRKSVRNSQSSQAALHPWIGASEMDGAGTVVKELDGDMVEIKEMGVDTQMPAELPTDGQKDNIEIVEQGRGGGMVIGNQGMVQLQPPGPLSPPQRIARQRRVRALFRAPPVPPNTPEPPRTLDNEESLPTQLSQQQPVSESTLMERLSDPSVVGSQNRAEEA